MGYFTTGRTDYELVAQMLQTFDAKKALRTAINARDVREVKAVFRNPEHFCETYTVRHLANEIFDDMFNTPLHVAVFMNSPQIVLVLYEYGACPTTNYAGNLPWERFAFPRFSAAADTARQGPDALVFLPSTSLKTELCRM